MESINRVEHHKLLKEKLFRRNNSNNKTEKQHQVRNDQMLFFNQNNQPKN